MNIKPDHYKMPGEPTWTEFLGFLVMQVQAGTPVGKRLALDELKRMATAADLWNAHVDAGMVKPKEELDL